MSNPTGQVTLEANGETYRLWLGMSVLADLQEQFGDEFDEHLSQIESGKMPNLKFMHSLFVGALQRWHSDVADRYLVDDIIAQNADALGSLMSGSTPEPEKSGGKRKAAG
jgi:hypothetical protein